MDIDDIKKKILEDVDPETKRKRAHERRGSTFRYCTAVNCSNYCSSSDILYVDGHIDRTGEFNVSDIA